MGPAPLIDSTAAGLSGANPTQLALCYGEADGAVVLDPAKVAGKIVVCDRGVTARVNKSLAVQEAGGIGMILVNTSVNSINADFHFACPEPIAGGRYAAAAERRRSADHRLQRACAVYRKLLVARPIACRQRRRAEARPDRARAGHPRGRRATGQLGQGLRSLQRDVDVEPARRRPCR
ncbi:MAG: hypothetical protein IPG28_19015 [Betaproteobacteria bacterium]|nr:hypothetical protein [Betaproteobacteria bacterium]